MKVKLISITENPEKIISYIARVSNPDNQNNPNYAKLIKFLIKNHHWSPFEHAHMTVEIVTSRAIAAQILRHRSFSFQEFSQRYSEVSEFEPIELRKQAIKNRQSSLEIFEPDMKALLGDKAMNANELIFQLLEDSRAIYNVLIAAGVAKEVARMILPLTTQTTIFMTGSVRSWIHYLDIRDDKHTQKEHQLIAKEIRAIFNEYLPTVAQALDELKKEQEEKDLLYALLLMGEITLPDEIKNEITTNT